MTAPYWLLRLADAIRPHRPVQLGNLKPCQAFTTIYEMPGHSGTFSGRVTRQSRDGCQVLITCYAWIGGEPGVLQVWHDSTTPVFRRHTCPALDRAAR